MAENVSGIAQAALIRLLKPLVRLLLRYGIPFGMFSDIAKRVYVELAMSEFGIPGRKPTVSRAAVITGLTRKEITRIQQLPAHSDEEIRGTYNRAVRVISGWVRDETFNDAQGAPAALTVEGAGASFAELVRKYSGDMPFRAVLDELKRVGAVTERDDGRVELRSAAYVPSDGEEEKLSIMGTDVADLISTINHNVDVPDERSRLQLTVSYDNLPREPLAQFRTLSAERAFELLKRLDEELSALDRDANPSVQGSGRMRAGIGIYYFEEEVSDED